MWEGGKQKLGRPQRVEKKIGEIILEQEDGEKGRFSGAGRREEVSSPPPIGGFGCSDVCLAVKADRQIAVNDMCWESSQRWANDRRGEAGRWLPSGKYDCSTSPVVWTETA